MDILTINDTPGRHAPSWYAQTADLPGPLPAARGRIRADVAIVGAGYTGLSAAVTLARAGLDVVVLEASRLGSGASGRNGGQAGTGQRVDQMTLEARHGPEVARRLWDFGLEAVALVRQRIAESRTDCQFTPGILHVTHRPREVAEVRAYAEHLQARYGYDRIRALEGAELRAELGSAAFCAGTLDTGGGHLHPLRYAAALAQLAGQAGARLFEQSRVIAIETGPRPRLTTAQAEIEADHLILAMNGYHNNLVPRLGRKVMPINNFIVATEPLPQDLARRLIPGRAAVADSRFVVNYFRLTPDNRLLFGGGESYGYRFPADLAQRARRPMVRIFPELRDIGITHAWGGTLGITMSRLPAFQRLGPSTLSCAGFSGHGVAMATLAGQMAAEAVQGQAGRFDTLAALPNAAFPGGAALRTPLLVAAMTWYGLRDRL